jgi:formylglycine-generating enzyme required for sulfatase activity
MGIKRGMAMIRLAVGLALCKNLRTSRFLGCAMMERVTLHVLLLSLAAAQALQAGSPLITNVVAGQRAGTKLVDIRYDALDPDNDPLKVRIEISNNGGRTFDVPALSVSGDVGANTAPGTNKLIVWNAGIDWDGEYSPAMVVKVIASDGHGLPELKWGTEIAPGGFLLGQDGGPEGAGPSRHVNIPWSFWFGKYEVTIGEYIDYLNMAIAAGEVYRDATKVYAYEERYAGVPASAILLSLGTDVQWSISRFVSIRATNIPVQVTWYGAMAFARHYGYDLPTEAEWEKAARGAGYEGAGEHQVYPWGDTISGGNANFGTSGDPYNEGRTPVGFFDGNQTPSGPDMTNMHGLYDVTGNVGEWTRTAEGSIENYPQMENLTNAVNTLDSGAGRIVRGGSYLDAKESSNLKCYGRVGMVKTLFNGFRVVRRSDLPPE